ncbi:MAG: metal-dependent transcriptional regulator [Candidatus Omnitrophica bacterium]|nr:metal-dependent transcriptional regulator [Candidatus Omnitrophota bacterium]
MKEKKITSSMEDYLEVIALLSEQKGVVRVKDISRLMRVKTPSVSGALAILSSNGLVVHERYGYVELTLQGQKLAKSVKCRHDMLIKFLNEILGVDFETASEDACRMEHTISPQTFNKLTEFIKSMGQL